MLNPEHYRQIAVYAALMGVSEQECIDEAMQDYIDHVASARLEAMHAISQIEKSGELIEFPSASWMQKVASA